MNRDYAELSDIIPFKEDDCWYLKLVYEYDDKKGKHTVIIPKASIPFSQRSFPSISRALPCCGRLLGDTYINCNNSMLLHESTCDLASERGIKEPGYGFDIITEYASREMTIDEIEKELGYKVKIINKEKNNAKN